MTFEEFLPEYLAAHSKRETRLLHAAGLLTGLGLATVAVVTRKPQLLLGGLLAGYGAAWFSHFAIEKNKPKTFEHPLLSFRGDFAMVWRLLRGRI